MQSCKNIYEPLATYLSRQPGRIVTLNFRKIQEILGTLLPKSARSEKRWWRNRSRSLQGSAWLSAQWRVSAVDLITRQVTFHKHAAPLLQLVFGNLCWDRYTVRSLRRHMKLTGRTFARLLGVSPQQVCHWERGRFLPRYAMNRRLTLLAQQANFTSRQ